MNYNNYNSNWKKFIGIKKHSGKVRKDKNPCYRRTVLKEEYLGT